MPKSDHSFDPSLYATVAQRITLFYREFPSGRIITELVSREGGTITFRALAFRAANGDLPSATGWASEREGDGDINAVACLENTETSAIGRALANLGFTASLNRPSREEMEKAQRRRLRLSVPQAGAGAPLPAGASRPNQKLQRKANAVRDLLDLLAAAERRGYSAQRARIIASRANERASLSFARLRRIEAAMRSWIRRHDPSM